MPELTTRHAERIARKLGAQVERTRKGHDRAVVLEGGKRVAGFGIRRGSGSNIGHDFIPGNLHITMHQCKQLAECPLSREGYLEILRSKGMI